MGKFVRCRPRIKFSAVQQVSWSVPALCAKYDWPTGLVGGGKIGIVELGGGYTQADLTQYFESINQPVPLVTDVLVGGVNAPGFSAADGEVALDMQVAGAAYYCATGKPATIVMIFANDIATAVRAAIKAGCDVCSISWGQDEQIWGQEALNDMEAAAQEAVAAGMIVFAATGDNDADDGTGVVGVDAPACCPHVVACGGTKLTATSEEVWNDTPSNANGEGTGGGYSAYFPAQDWQTGAPPAAAVVLKGDTPTATGRMIPDVAANADPVTGYQIVLRGQQTVIGGTSAATPLMASLFAAFGTKLGFVTPKLWGNPGCFTDITEGNNGVYIAMVGPDPCSGLGSPKGAALAKLFGVGSAMSPHGSGAG